MVEDLLDFPNDDESIILDATFDSVPENSTHSSTLSSFSGYGTNSISNSGSHNLVDAHLCGDLCVPDDDDIAEMEWLSNFVEESFSCEDLQKLELISGMKARKDDPSKSRKFQLEPNRNNPLEVFVPVKARSKRSRMPPCNWTSRLLVFTSMISLSSNPNIIIQTPTMSSIPISIIGKKSTKVGLKRKDSGDDVSSGDGRKCLHCATDKTPQWRTGPMGPKTLCNACGVRYKSGRLVPEYRPASSPTFVLAKHSNSHRKVLELRRQKEMVREANNNNSCNIIFNT
ncbi:hypothetical protein TanjilG_20857 [Lupinus angustifolius]|uniref:GATA transcription factor n=1 Tax=Lupinus angustifolius TaxID=3871 RepID=A0A1J7HNL6_LUPAN|nr:hypothetical protein TanjilG_20854 [Lupinus angustifolius]OIW14411.1 hypothetical protein TanjilG_20857 [Lupinus angustifolius]